MDLDTSVYIALAVVVLGAIYWFFLRDDNGFPDEDFQLLDGVKFQPVKPSSLGTKKTMVKNKDGPPLKILFYSQTGTAEDFAKRLGDDTNSYGFSPDILDVDEVDEPDVLGSDRCLIFFAATYGEGDPPDNALVFHKWLMDPSRETDTFKDISYTVFGLGNKTYDQYNVVGQQIDKRLEELGGVRLYQLGLGNDDENIENDFLVWKKGFAPVLCKKFGMEPPGDLTQTKITFKQKMNVYPSDDARLRSFDPEDLHKIPRFRVAKSPGTIDRNNPHLATLLTKKELHKTDSGRSCLHLEISTHGDLLSYHTGDHIGIYPCNSPYLVDRLAKVLKVELDQVVSLQNLSEAKPFVGPCTMRALLLQYFDIAFHVKKQLLRVLAQFASDKTQKERLFLLGSDDPDRQAEYEAYIVKSHRTVCEVLEEFTSVEVPIAHFLEFLPKLQPRFYSISSSSRQDAKSVHVTAVVDSWVTTTGRQADGVCTTWFSQESTVFFPSFIRKSTFRPPKLESHMIMIGPGTGLAPFRGFLQERKHLLSLPENKDAPKGECFLFFGCRTRSDFLYEEELVQYHKDGVLTDLQVAFSRINPEQKEYVQHLMAKGDTPKKLWELINAGAYFYVCGDAKLMARDVGDTLTKIISEQGQMSKEAAEKYLEKMQLEGRHQSDVWS